jgi:hypothetical protein
MADYLPALGGPQDAGGAQALCHWVGRWVKRSG